MHGLGLADTKGNDMKTYRIYLGLKEGSKHITAGQFDAWRAESPDRLLDGFTLIYSDGYWKGENEPSVVLEFIGTAELAGVIQAIASSYATTFHQSSVIVTSHDVDVQFIKGGK